VDETGIRIVKQDTETTFNERSEPVESIRVVFLVDKDGPFIKRFAKENFSGVAAKMELETFAREIRALRT
jgi:hypothetical protein